MSTHPSAVRRLWRRIRQFVAGLFGPDSAADHRSARQGQMHPIQQNRNGWGSMGGTNF